jgi:hypothetical protein
MGLAPDRAGLALFFKRDDMKRGSLQVGRNHESIRGHWHVVNRHGHGASGFKSSRPPGARRTGKFGPTIVKSEAASKLEKVEFFCRNWIILIHDRDR